MDVNGLYKCFSDDFRQDPIQDHCENTGETLNIQVFLEKKIFIYHI